jgi:hypothetical protein
MRIVAALACLMVCLASAGASRAQTKTYTWSDIDCRQSRIMAWPGLKCRATNVVTNEGNIGVFRQWAAFGTTREGYYAQMFVWEARNTFSYVSAEETTADFLKWMFEYGKSVTQVSPVARYQDADYVTFRDDQHERVCVGFRRMGKFQRGGYDSLTGGLLCAPPGKNLTNNDIAIFIDHVRLQQVAG